MVRSLRKKDEQREKRNKIIIGVIMTVLMIGSIMGFFVGDFNNNNNTLEYKSKNGKKYIFEPGNGQMYTKIDGKMIAFYNHPLDVEKLDISSEAVNLIKNAQVSAITFNPESRDVQFFEQTRFDMANDFQSFNKYIITGVTKNITSYSSFIMITCKNSTTTAPVINFVSENVTETRGYVENNCIIFEGKKYDFLKFRDYMLYKMYDII